MLGFIVTGFDGFAESESATLIVFEVNPLHNIVHLIDGAFLAASSRVETARIVSLVVGAVYLLVGVLGLALAGNSDLNLLALNQADSALHLVSGAAALAVAVAAGRPLRGHPVAATRTRRTRTSPAGTAPWRHRRPHVRTSSQLA